MKTPLYYKALKNSWHLAWEHKMLWIFGMFAAFLGQVGILNLLSKVGMAVSNSPSHISWRGWWAFTKYLFVGAKDMNLTTDAWVWFFCLLLILLGFVIVLIFVSIVSQGAIIKAAALSAKHKKLPDVDEAWHAGVSHFWRLFFVNLSRKILFCLLAGLVYWITYKTLTGTILNSGFLFLILFILASLVGLVISFLTIYTAGYIVVEEYGFFKAIKSAWKMFADHWLVSIEVGLVMIVATLFLGLIVLFGMMIAFLPTLFTWIIAGWTYNYTLAYAGLLVGVGLSTILIVFVGSVFTVFNISTWTYLFMKMHKTGIKSRILHIFGH